MILCVGPGIPDMCCVGLPDVSERRGGLGFLRLKVNHCIPELSKISSLAIFQMIQGFYFVTN